MIVRHRRQLVALGASLALHVGAVGGVVGLAVVRGLSLHAPIEIEITKTPTEPPKDLPLGPQPRATAAPALEPPPKAKTRHRSRPAAGSMAMAGGEDGGVVDAGAGDGGQDALGDAGVVPDGGTVEMPKPDLRAAGPEGSRVTALLRLDRLRENPDYIPLTDSLLSFLPDRRRLVRGSDLDIYRDFDVLLIATPNPLDDAVTFLAVRHHVADDRMQTQLSRAANTANRPIVWQQRHGRPVGVREVPGADNASTDLARGLARDDRLLLLPGPGIAVIAPPAYATLLLDPPAAGDGGASTQQGFAGLAARLDAESEAITADAVFRLVAANLFSRSKAASLAQGNALVTPMAGLAPPQILDVTVGVVPSPWVEMLTEFETSAEAEAWARALPRLRQQYLGNALLALSGLTQVLANVTVDHQPGTRAVTVRTRATREQVSTLVNLIVNLMRAR